MRPLRPLLLMCLLVLTAGLSGMNAVADAFWPFGRWFGDGPAESAVVAPPPADAIQTQCDPIKRKIQELNQSHRAVHPFMRPRIGLLKREYHECIYRINQQEYEYLKGATIEIPPEDQENEAGQNPAARAPVQDLPPLAPPAEN